ncbi:hypothetical protein Bbelb_045180 [Branchiostoma belcheri]|nr:hypothetical protein Bbelb_045180 [Branchiostoma belcheri]
MHVIPRLRGITCMALMGVYKRCSGLSLKVFSQLLFGGSRITDSKNVLSRDSPSSCPKQVSVLSRASPCGKGDVAPAGQIMATGREEDTEEETYFVEDPSDIYRIQHGVFRIARGIGPTAGRIARRPQAGGRSDSREGRDREGRDGIPRVSEPMSAMVGTVAFAVAVLLLWWYCRTKLAIETSVIPTDRTGSVQYLPLHPTAAAGREAQEHEDVQLSIEELGEPSQCD